MTLAAFFLWPGTKVCERLGVDPEADVRLIRWMINTIIYLVVSLAILWAVMA